MNLDANWIWTDFDADTPGQMAQFRLLFGPATRCRWTGFADTLYTLFCNGHAVGVGPTLGHHRKPFVTTWELTKFLKDGENELMLEVWFEGRRKDCCDAEPIQGGVIGSLDLGHEVIPTGPGWQARHLAHYTMPGPEGWRLFASHRLIIADLRQPLPDWTSARSLAAHPDRGECFPSPIPPLTCTEIPVQRMIDAGIARGDMPVVLAEDVAKRLAAQTHESLIRPSSKLAPIFNRAGNTVSGLPAKYSWPVQVPEVDGDYYITLDGGVQTSGCVRLDVETNRDTVIDVAYGDSLELDGRVNPRSQDHSLADRLILSKGRNKIRLPHDRGFRYLQISSSAPSVFHDVRIEEHVFPYGMPMEFRCSDMTLNAIWDLCLATLRQCSLTTLVDNARRERQGWGGPDLVVVNDGVLFGFGDARLAGKKLDDFCDFFDAKGYIPCFAPGHSAWVKAIPSHDLWFPAGALRYVLFTNDQNRAGRLLKVSEAVLAGHNVRSATGGWKWAEWNLNTAGEICTWEVLLAVQAWRAVAELRRYCGRTGDTPSFDNLVERLWHPGHQALAQGTSTDGALLDFCGQLDNALALQLDILPPDKAVAAYKFCAGRSGTWPTNRSGWQGGALGERVRHDPRKPVVAGSPFASQLCAETMFHCGQAREAVQYIRYNFGAMLDEGEGGTWELWPVTRSGIAATCQSQGFGAGLPATFIRDLLGVRFTSPGATELICKPPRNSGLDWVEGTVQTTRGRAKIRWDQQGVHAELPEGVILHT